MWTVVVPSTLAWTFASLTPSVSFALIGVVFGEFIGGESGGGIGYLIIASLGSLNAADMYGGARGARGDRYRAGPDNRARRGASPPLAPRAPGRRLTGPQRPVARDGSPQGPTARTG